MLTPDEFRGLLAELTAEPYRTMVILTGCLGIARSEFVGLKWADINWDAAILSVQRGVVHCHVGNPKTLARRKPIPLAPELLTILREHRERTAYAADSDWVFASPYKRGAEPYWPDSALQDFVKPAVKESRNHEAGRLAHVQAQLQHVAQGQRCGCQGAKRTATALQHRYHSQPVHTSRQRSETGGSRSGCWSTAGSVSAK